MSNQPPFVVLFPYVYPKKLSRIASIAIRQQMSAKVNQHLISTLAQQLQCDETNIQLTTQTHGKKILHHNTDLTPGARTNESYPPIHFSISHSPGLSGYAIHHQNLGFDITPIDSSHLSQSLKLRLFKKLIKVTSPSNHQNQRLLQVQNLPCTDLVLAKLWTCLEALTKFHGDKLWRVLAQQHIISPDDWSTLVDNHQQNIRLADQWITHQAWITEHTHYCLCMCGGQWVKSPRIKVEHPL